MQHEANHQVATAGRLILLLGPSGSGKDSLIDAARVALARAGVEVARRVITRSAEAVGEEAHAVTTEQFAALCEEGAFALHWHANSLSYGIPAHIDAWLAGGRSVLVNGSRGHLAQARERYPQLLAVSLQVDPEVLRQRLLARGRESLAEVEQRLARSARLQADGLPGVRLLDNSGPLVDTVQRLLALLGEEGVIDPQSFQR